MLSESVRELLRDLKTESFWVRLDARVKEPLSDRKTEFFSERLDDEPTEAERDWVDATLPLRSTAIATHAELVPRHSVFVTEVLPVLSNPEPVTREVFTARGYESPVVAHETRSAVTTVP